MSRPFDNFAPLQEEHFCPHVARRIRTRSSVSVFRVLVSDNHARYERASLFVHLCTIFNVSVTINHLLSSSPVPFYWEEQTRCKGLWLRFCSRDIIVFVALPHAMILHTPVLRSNVESLGL